MKQTLICTKSRRKNLVSIPKMLLSMVFVLGVHSTSQAGVIAQSSSLTVNTLAGLDPYEVVDSASVSQGGVVNTIGLVNASATSTSPSGTLITSGSGMATWDNTASGQVRFENIGWDNSDFSPHTSSKSSLAGTQWTYTFIADVTGFFSLAWDVSLQQPEADSFGLQDFRFSLGGGGGGPTVMTVDSTGSTSRNIIAGNEYTALITTNAGILGGVGGRTSFMDGIFDWSMDSGPMSSVPEPSSIALLGLGLMGIRVAKRSRLSRCRAV